MSFIINLRRALGLDNTEADLEDEILRDTAPKPTHPADRYRDSKPMQAAPRPQPMVQLPDSLIKAIHGAVEQWRKAQSPGDSVTAETVSLQRKLDETRSKAEHQKQAFNDQLADLRKQIASLEKEKATLANSRMVLKGNEGKAPATIATAADNGKLTKEIERLKQLNSQLDLKSKMSDKMLSDLQAENSKMKQEIEALRQQLPDAEVIAAQINKAAEALEKKDARIATLNKTIDELRATVKSNLEDQTLSERRLRKEIQELKDELEKARRAPRRGRPPKNENTSSAPADEIDNASAFTDSSDFGYHPPKPGPELPFDVPTLFD